MKKSNNKWTPAKYAEALALKRSGKSTKEVGEAFGIAGARAREVIAKAIRLENPIKKPPPEIIKRTNPDGTVSTITILPGTEPDIREWIVKWASSPQQPS